MAFYWIKGRATPTGALHANNSLPCGPMLIEAATPEEARAVALRRNDYTKREHVLITATEEDACDLLWWISGCGGMSLALTLEDAQSGSHLWLACGSIAEEDAQ